MSLVRAQHPGGLRYPDLTIRDCYKRQFLGELVNSTLLSLET